MSGLAFIKVLQAMNDRYCGSVDDFKDKARKCRNVETWYDKVSKECGARQVPCCFSQRAMTNISESRTPEKRHIKCRSPRTLPRPMEKISPKTEHYTSYRTKGQKITLMVIRLYSEAKHMMWMTSLMVFIMVAFSFECNLLGFRLVIWPFRRGKIPSHNWQNY
eukprot:6458892-Amphidinium_carterae.1